MQSIIQKLNTLKSAQPGERWIVETRKEVLSKAPVLDGFSCDLERIYQQKSIFNFNNLFASKLVVSFTVLAFVLFGSFSASYASKSSLPGEMLYSVKMASESMELAVASEDNKAEIEIGQAGKRLEEAVEISKKPSDINQGEKIKQLAASFEKKVNNAQDGLTKIGDSGKKAKTAKVINVQTEKYTEVLVVASDNLTNVVKNDVSENLASATDSNKKVNLDSLAVRVKVMTKDDKDEITAIVNGKVEKEAVLKEETGSDGADLNTNVVDLNSCSSGVDLSPRSDNSVSETDQDATKEEALSDATKDGKTNQDPDISEDTEDTVETEHCSAPTTIEKTKKELMKLLDNLNTIEEGAVKGVSDDNSKGNEVIVAEEAEDI